MYDFNTVINRRNQGSIKWKDMYDKNPDVGDFVVPLSVADMELKNPPEITEGLKEYLDDVVLGYTTATDEYRQAVVDFMKRRHDFHIEKDWIVNSGGVVPAIFSAIQCFTGKDDGVIIFTPVYYPFYIAVEANERKLVDCPLLCDENNYYTIDFEKFEDLAARDENKVLLLCSPHNPVGRVWTREELKEVERIVLKYDLLLLSDEIHFDLIMPSYEHTVIQTLSDELAERTITMTAPSKTFNLAGMGMSNIIIKNDKLRKQFADYLWKFAQAPATALGYKACELAYTKCDKWLEECLELIDTNQHIVHDFFAREFPQIKAPLIEGTYLQWIDFSSLAMSDGQMEEFMCKKAQVFFDEGYIFGRDGSGFERINLAAPSHVIEESLERLAKALHLVY